MWAQACTSSPLGLWFVPSGVGSLTKRVNTLGPSELSALRPSEEAAKTQVRCWNHSQCRDTLGQAELMWTKAELTKGPHSCPAGPTAPLVDLVQHQGRCDPLHRARPRLRKHGAAFQRMLSQGPHLWAVGLRLLILWTLYQEGGYLAPLSWSARSSAGCD